MILLQLGTVTGAVIILSFLKYYTCTIKKAKQKNTVLPMFRVRLCVESFGCLDTFLAMKRFDKAWALGIFYVNSGYY